MHRRIVTIRQRGLPRQEPDRAEQAARDASEIGARVPHDVVVARDCAWSWRDAAVALGESENDRHRADGAADVVKGIADRFPLGVCVQRACAWTFRDRTLRQIPPSGTASQTQFETIERATRIGHLHLAIEFISPVRAFSSDCRPIAIRPEPQKCSL
jgi:hypothetical protein